MNEDKHEVLRGHFEECFEHLGACLVSRAPKGSRGAAQAKKPVADFCGVTIDTVSRWLRGTGSLPIGEQYIKLMYYLDMVGYRVIELERMPKGQRNFAELIGFGILSSKQAAELLGYFNTSTLYRVLQGDQGASEDKDQKMWNAWKERREELEQKKIAHELYHLDVSLTAHPKAEEATPMMLPSRQTALANIMEGLLTLLEEESFEKLSEDGLTDLRRSVSRLSARLSALSSRLIMSEQRKGGKLMSNDRGYQAVVEKIIYGGKHGPYAVARSEELGSVTFSLDPEVWQEKDCPEPGMCVMLSQIRKKRAGWRAKHGRFIEPSDEQQPSIRKEHRA